MIRRPFRSSERRKRSAAALPSLVFRSECARSIEDELPFVVRCRFYSPERRRRSGGATKAQMLLSDALAFFENGCRIAIRRPFGSLERRRRSSSAAKPCSKVAASKVAATEAEGGLALLVPPSRLGGEMVGY